MKILFFDLETTGMITPWTAAPTETTAYPEIVEIAWIMTDGDGRTLNEFESLVKGTKTSQYTAFNLHRISLSQRNEHGIDEAEILQQFSWQVEAADMVVCHSIGYDVRVAQARFIANRIECPIMLKPNFCTRSDTRDIVKKKTRKKNAKHKFKYPKLSELYQFLFKTEMHEGHRAAVDALATKECYFELKNQKLI